MHTPNRQVTAMEILTTLLLLGQMIILQIREGSSAETGTPVLTMEPMWERFLTGDRIVLSCDAGGELRSVRYKWIINNITKEFRGKIYTIETAGIEHNVEYRCQTLTQTTAYSNSILASPGRPGLRLGASFPTSALSSPRHNHNPISTFTENAATRPHPGLLYLREE
ncbi:low affinity immunoglobulin gamma Fc region receptor III-A-like [Rhincodon typus]|uniref:low affinity immunoglobulin gamma Fc region receptor III-A-like n=1 Tax=Rhincodon typus TaxID=259920 RepID=UPI00202E3C68|nr:low affinity immunoglobulin gamma Fc region receptor III-A-like [Rhincodon typus]